MKEESNCEKCPRKCWFLKRIIKLNIEKRRLKKEGRKTLMELAKVLHG